MFPLPGDYLTQIATSSAAVFQDLFPIVALISGILLAVGVSAFIIRSVIYR